MQAMEGEVVSSGGALGNAYTTFAASSPFFTVSGGASHVPGPIPGKYGIEKSLTLRSQVNAPALIISTYGDECPVEPELAQEFRTLLDLSFTRLEARRDWSKVNLHLHYVAAGQGVERKSYAFHFGRRVDLNLMFSCASKTAMRDQFYGFLVGTHEMSHAMFHLVGVDKRPGLEGGGRGDELLAEGGPACIYRALEAQGDPLSLSSVLSERDHFANAWETFQEPEENRKQWCSNWVDALHGL